MRVCTSTKHVLQGSETVLELLEVLSLLTLNGAGTWYSEADWSDNLMYCNCSTALGCNLRYSPRLGIPWVAIDPKYMRERDWQCGDRLVVHFLDHQLSKEVRVLDAGDLARHCIAELDCAEIVVDFAEHHWPLSTSTLSARVRVVNMSKALRLMHFVTADPLMRGVIP